MKIGLDDMGTDIVVCDDDPGTVDALATLLRMAAFRVAAVTDPWEAEELIDALRPRLVILDVRMPGLDGLELGRKVKARAAADGRGLPIIIYLTGIPTDAIDLDAWLVGAHELVQKPVDPEPFLARVRELMALE